MYFPFGERREIIRLSSLLKVKEKEKDNQGSEIGDKWGENEKRRGQNKNLLPLVEIQ